MGHSNGPAAGASRWVWPASRTAAVVSEAAAIAAHLRRVNPRFLGQLIRRVRLASACLHDAFRREYPYLPWKTAGSLAAALTYFLAPLDAIPDLLPLSGFVDDAAMLGLVFMAVEADLRRYCEWRGLDPTPYFG